MSTFTRWALARLFRTNPDFENKTAIGTFSRDNYQYSRFTNLVKMIINLSLRFSDLF